MWLESEPGIGTTFFFTLPTSLPEEHIVGPGRWIKSDWVWREDAFTSARTGSKDRPVRPYVILCDENDTLHAGCARYCDEIEFVHAGDLAQVVQELQHCPAHAVVLNATTSDETWSLAERARQEMPGTPVVICSVPRPIQRAVDAGALGHLTKPVTRVGLEKAIQTVGKPVRRVLVVDDDPDALRLFTRMLRACDSTLEIVTASSGEQALEELRDAPPDLALLDIVMPDMDGWQLLESMGQDRSIEDVPVFFVSANDPVDYPLVSEFLLTTIDRGIPLSRLPRYSLEVSALLLKTEKELGPVHAQTRGVALASTDRRQRQATLPVSHP